jgi:hypothetical protein
LRLIELDPWDVLDNSLLKSNTHHVSDGAFVASSELDFNRLRWGISSWWTQRLWRSAVESFEEVKKMTREL